MNGIWMWFLGHYRIRLTGAEPERSIRFLSSRIQLQDVCRESDLSATFLISKRTLSFVRSSAQSRGDRIEVLEEQGLPVKLRGCIRFPLLSFCVMLLLLATILLPGRILFIQVVGNQAVPEDLILERAEQCGLSFWTSREALRSEQIKNRLLQALPELSWVGVNTRGCCAVISVRERKPEPADEPSAPGNIIAVTDAVITSVTATVGKALCAPGDAVRRGQILISGFTDLGLCIHVERAEGEIYGLTRRENRVVLPAGTRIQEESGVVEKKYSLFIGKKRINFYSDSGILHTGCGKMTQIRYLRLPGGWTLPIGVITEVYTPALLRETRRWEPDAMQLLQEMSIRMLQQQMTAGRILKTKFTDTSSGQIISLSGVFECQEMIGRRSNGIITEGDMQYDRENGERGAG